MKNLYMFKDDLISLVPEKWKNSMLVKKIKE